MAGHRIDHRHVAERVQVFPESVIRDMTRVAMRDGAINLAQGFPDFDPPREILDAAKHLDRARIARKWTRPRFEYAHVSHAGVGSRPHGNYASGRGR
jgi:hypothetical protein